MNSAHRAPKETIRVHDRRAVNAGQSGGGPEGVALDQVLEHFNSASLGGECLPWRDSLLFGPSARMEVVKGPILAKAGL